MRSQLVKLIKYNKSADVMYMAASGKVTKRRISVIRVGDDTFWAYCYLRGAKRTFRIDNVLALVPVIQKESMVI